MSIDLAIRKQEHDIFMARHGLHSESLSRLERRLEELHLERDRLRQQDLDAAAILDRLTAPKLREPSCLRAMGADEYFNGRGELREQRNVEGHH